jgi:hypothetical protein
MGIQQWLNENDGKNQSTWRKTCPSATCSPQIPHGLAWNQSHASVAKLPHCMHTILTCKREWHSANGCEMHLDSNPDFNEHRMFSACLLFSNDHAQDACYWSLNNLLGVPVQQPQ